MYHLGKRVSFRKSKKAMVARVTAGYVGFTPEFKALIFARDGRRCRIMRAGVRCPNPAAQVHHVIPVERGGKTVPINCISICRHCHHKRPGHGHMR